VLNVRLHLLLEESAGTGACLHGQGEGGKACGSFIDFHAVQVVFENQAGNIARRIPLLLVDLIQQVERVGKHVAGTACRIAYGQVFRSPDCENILVPDGIIL